MLHVYIYLQNWLIKMGEMLLNFPAPWFAYGHIMAYWAHSHLSVHRALHTNYARISRKRMKNVVAHMDGPWPISQIPIDLGLFGR